jgi:hypothetical protein
MFLGGVLVSSKSSIAGVLGSLDRILYTPLHQFEIDGKSYGEHDPYGEVEIISEKGRSSLRCLARMWANSSTSTSTISVMTGRIVWWWNKRGKGILPGRDHYASRDNAPVHWKT